MLGYEAGFRELFSKKVYVDIAAFHNNYTDLQSFGAEEVSVSATPPPTHVVITIPYTNQIGGWTNGVEIAPNWQVTPWWRLTGSYSYVGIDTHANGATSDISSTGSVNTYDNSTPHHLIELQSTVNLPAGFEFDQFYRYASSLTAQKVPSYQTMDARLGYKFAKELELSLVGQNLFQPRHFEWGTGDPSQQLIGIKRAAYAKLVWTR
jgi:iron complex outermembrane receptor protein